MNQDMNDPKPRRPNRLGGLYDHEREPTGIEEIDLSADDEAALDAAESARDADRKRSED